jgi:hypothetical protein
MNFAFRDGDVLVKAYFGARSIFAVEDQIEAARRQIDYTSDLVTSVPRFVTRSAVADEVPVALMMHRLNRFYGVALVCLRSKRGIPTGIVSGGDETGQGGVISHPEDRIGVLEAASRILLKLPFIHTVLLSTVWSEADVLGNGPSGAGIGVNWQFRQVGFTLDLGGGREATMERLGYKMRRNLGYYKRRAEAQLGCQFLPELSAGQRVEAVEELFDKGTYQLGRQRSRQLNATLQALPGSFASGLRNSEGEWLSYVAGWRGPEGTYIDWQLNRQQPENASISTVIRSYLLDLELESRSPAVIFVGGTAPQWSRACKQVICGELLMVRRGIVGYLSRRLARRFSPSGKIARLQGKPVLSIAKAGHRAD